MFDNVVVGASGSRSGARAVRRAAELAGASGGTVHIVAAFHKKPAEELLAQLQLLASESSALVRSHPLQTDAVDAITRVAAEEKADLIVVGSRDLGRSRRLSGVPRGIMEKAECAVLVV
jgi:nucleotide-binding universal stress UspA family protein